MSQSMVLEAMWVLATRLVNRASNLLIFLLLARSLSQAEFGSYGYIVATALVLSIAADLGLRQSSALLIGRDPGAMARVATHLLAAWVVLASASAAIAWLTVDAGGQEGGYPLTGPLAAATVAAMLWIRMGQGLFLGQGRIRDLNQSELVSRAVMLGGTALLWSVGLLTFGHALWILLLAHLAAGGWLLWQVRGFIQPRLLLDRALVPAMVRHGLAFAGGVLMLSLMGRVGIWIVGALLPPADLGAYIAVIRVGEMVVEVATAVGVVIFSHGVRASDPKAAALEAARVNRAALPVMALAALVAGILATPLLGVMLGPAYADETLAFRIVLLGTVPSCLATMLYPSLTSQGHARWGLLVFGPGVLANALLTWILAPAWGVPGATTAAALANLLSALILLVIYRRRLEVGFGQLLLLQPADLRAGTRELGRLARRLLGKLGIR